MRLERGVHFQVSSCLPNGLGTMNHQSRDSLENMARVGFGARGVVYCLVGGLAIIAALGSGGQTTGSRGALATLIGEPYGRVLLGAIALGLACFAIWRVVEAISDADGHGSSGKGLALRGGHLLSGVIYAGLAFFAFSLALGWGSGGSGNEDQSAQDWTAWLMQQPFGRWMVGFIGLVVAGAGLAFIWKGWTGDVAQFLQLTPERRRWVVPLGRAGHAARGVVFVIIGAFVVVAAVQVQSSQVRGLGGALETVEQQSFGWLLLALTAAGLFAFGAFGFAQALYRRIRPPDLYPAG